MRASALVPNLLAVARAVSNLAETGVAVAIKQRSSKMPCGA
ncbi:phosphoribosylformylglycinamidine synthase II [Alicyclobacillus hesperidum URH17-3-68]|nr:phosphoribosylformylglycinamidine synthase II [Alicyclobacillus hesperidum URH17-3-68]